MLKLTCLHASASTVASFHVTLTFRLEFVTLETVAGKIREHLRMNNYSGFLQFKTPIYKFSRKFLIITTSVVVSLSKPHVYPSAAVKAVLIAQNIKMTLYS